MTHQIKELSKHIISYYRVSGIQQYPAYIKAMQRAVQWVFYASFGAPLEGPFLVLRESVLV